MRRVKALGQHFLHDPGLLARIAAVTEAAEGDVVLEIGPGQGGLTAALLDRGATVVAIERDARMGAELTRRFSDRPFALIEGDALELDWPALVRPWTDVGATWRVAGNIPYYITSPLLEMALAPPMPASITYLVQLEVARRLAAAPGTSEYGALTVGVTAAAAASLAMTVGRRAFSPPPKVDSAVVHLVPHADPPIAPGRIADLRRLVVSLFSYRRKRMHRAVREALGIDAPAAAALLERAAIDPDVRPEGVTVEEFVRLLGTIDDGR